MVYDAVICGLRPSLWSQYIAESKKPKYSRARIAEGSAFYADLQNNTDLA
jgi:hypothetical protein